MNVKLATVALVALYTASMPAYAAIEPGSLRSTNNGTDEYCLTYESDASPDTFAWQDCAQSSSIDATDLAADSVGVDEFAAGPVVNIVFCGQQANNGTIYLGPADDSYDAGGGEYAIGGVACDALDSATEATADGPISIASNNAIKVTGMTCKASSSGSNGVAFTLRTGAAATTPSIGCTVATSATTCTDNAFTTTDIVAGATMAVRAVNTEDLSAQDGWCVVTGVIVE